MAKKVILKDDNVEIMPITRGELVLDSSGQLAFHSSQFLATQSLPGLMSAADKTKLDNTQSAIVDSALSTTSDNAVKNKVITVAINEAKTLANNAQDAADDALDTANSAQGIANAIKASYLKSASVSGNLLTLTDLDDEETKFNNTTYTFESGSNGSFTVTPVGGTAQTVTVGGVLTDDKVKQTNTTSSGSYRLLFSYTADNTTRTEGARKSSKLLFNPDTGALTATSFSGNLAWSSLTGVPETFAPSAHKHATSQINALTSYTKATAAAALATTDSLNAALGKLEYKLDIAYDLVTKANDKDGTIENLKEILDVLADIKDTETIKAIVGKYLPLAGGTMNNGATIKFNANGGLIQTTATTSNATAMILWYKGTAKDANYSYAAQIGWHNTGDSSGAIYLVPNPQNSEPWGGSVGLYIGKTSFKWNNKIILHSGNTYISNGTITINGTSITPLTSHQSLANYVTLNTALTISGVKTFSTLLKFTVAQGTAPFTVTSNTKVTNLNSDLLDGYDSSRFLRAKDWVTSPGLDANTLELNMMCFTYSNNAPHTGTIIYFSGATGGSYGLLLNASYSSSGHLSFRSRNGDNGTWKDWSTILTLHSYTNYVNTTNFPGLNKTGTVTSVTVTGANGLSGTGTITTSGTITLSNAGVRSTTINGNYLRVNTNGTNADLTIPYATVAKALNHTTLTSGLDLNTLTTEGVYSNTQTSICNSLVNGPTGRTNGECRLEVINCGSSSHSLQWLYTKAGKQGEIWYRMRTSDATWSTWNKIAFTSLIPTVTNYYWANVKVSTSSSTSTLPTFYHTRILGSNPALYIRNTNTAADTYSIIRFGNSDGDDKAYIFLNGPSRTGDGGANMMTIRNNVGNLRLNNNVLVTGSLSVNDRLVTNTTGMCYVNSTSERRAGMYGIYDSTKVGHIWSMGTGYAIEATGSNTGNLYGLAYFHTNWSNASAKNDGSKTEVSPYAGNHQAAWVINGKVCAALGNYVWSRNGFVKHGSDDTYALTGGGGHKAIGNVQNTAFYKRETSVNGTVWNMAGTTNSAAFTIYAPTTAGTSNYILKSNGSGAPTWIALSSITAGSANWLNVNSTLTYGASGLNYFNINGTAGNTKANNTPTSAWYHVLRMNHANSGGYLADIAVPLNDVGGIWWRQIRNGAFYGWYKLLDNNNSAVSGGGSSGGSSITVNIGGTSKTLTIPTSLPANGGTSSYVVVNSSNANSTYRMVWHSGNTLYGTNNIYCNPSTDQIYSAGFRHVSYNSASYLLRSDGGAAAFNWSGQSGQPTWLWGGNSQHTYYVYNPSNFNVNSAAKLRVVSCYNGTTNNDLWSTIKSSNSSYLGTSTMYEVYNDGGPTTYGHVLDTVTVHSNHWQSQLWMASGKSGRMYYRNKDYNNNTWGDWRTVAWTSDIGKGTVTIKQAGTTKGSFTMNQSGNTTIELTDNNTNTHWTTRIYAGASGTAANAAATNPYLKVTDDNTYRNLVRFVGGGATTVSSDASGNITISSKNTTYSFAAKGSATQGIYLSGTNTFATMTYSLKATVNAGTASKLAYYSEANLIGSYNTTVGGSYWPVYMNAGVPTRCTLKLHGSCSFNSGSSGSLYVYQFGPIVVVLGYITKIALSDSTTKVFTLPSSAPTPYDKVGFCIVQRGGYENDRNTVLYINAASRECHLMTSWNDTHPNGDYYPVSFCYITSSSSTS